MGLRALILALACAGTLAQAEQRIPSQEGWNDARETVTLADGTTLAYVTLAVGEGTPLILLHGYTDNSRSWSLVAPHLGVRPIYALDLRGHGASDTPACCYGIDALTQDLAGFMDALAIDRADLVGHSLGSINAAVFAALHPERVNRLVLVSSALATPVGATDWLWANVPTLSHPIDPAGEFMQAWYWNPTPVDEVFLRYEMAESASRPPQVWMGVLTALTMTDWTKLAPRITAPTLILWGDQDSLFGGAEQDALRTALPGAQHFTFQGLGHNMFWETPAQAGDMIVEFLAQ